MLYTYFLRRRISANRCVDCRSGTTSLSHRTYWTNVVPARWPLVDRSHFDIAADAIAVWFAPDIRAIAREFFSLSFFAWDSWTPLSDWPTNRRNAMPHSIANRSAPTVNRPIWEPAATPILHNRRDAFWWWCDSAPDSSTVAMALNLCLALSSLRCAPFAKIVPWISTGDLWSYPSAGSPVNHHSTISVSSIRPVCETSEWQLEKRKIQYVGQGLVW